MMLIIKSLSSHEGSLPSPLLLLRFDAFCGAGRSVFNVTIRSFCLHVLEISKYLDISHEMKDDISQ